MLRPKPTFSPETMRKLNVTLCILKHGMKDDVHIIRCTITESDRQLAPKPAPQERIVTVRGRFRLGPPMHPAPSFQNPPRTFKVEFMKKPGFVYVGGWLWVDGVSII